MVSMEFVSELDNIFQMQCFLQLYSCLYTAILYMYFALWPSVFSGVFSGVLCIYAAVGTVYIILFKKGK